MKAAMWMAPEIVRQDNNGKLFIVITRGLYRRTKMEDGGPVRVIKNIGPLQMFLWDKEARSYRLVHKCVAKVDCPRCLAKPRECCSGPSGTTSGTHAARRNAYRIKMNKGSKSQRLADAFNR